MDVLLDQRGDPVGQRLGGRDQATGVLEVADAADHEDSAQHDTGEGAHGFHGSVIPRVGGRYPGNTRKGSAGMDLQHYVRHSEFQRPSRMDVSGRVRSRG
ncbi:hypothetical protein GCM10023176_52770 [Micromonospora coerulea]|uniref:Uncharacterized protein n=1 Tax=Micromonospora coerulea TaxID=47856 RepID=A0ABP8T021_9ACTN